MITDKEGLNRKINQLQGVLEFIERNRQSGTSTLLAKVGATNDCYVIVGNRNTRDMMLSKMQTCDTNKVHSLSDISQYRMNGCQRKPILFDTDAIQFITTDFQILCDAINNQQDTIRSLEYEVCQSKSKLAKVQEDLINTTDSFIKAKEEIIRLQKELINATINKESNFFMKIINKIKGRKENENQENKEKDC